MSEHERLYSEYQRKVKEIELKAGIQNRKENLIGITILATIFIGLSLGIIFLK